MDKRWFFPIAVFTLLVGIAIAGGVLFVRPAPKKSLEAAEPAAKEVVNDVLAARRAELEAAGDVSFGSDNEINILAIGLDSRKEGIEQHCDSIHMVTLRLDDWSIKITSVPRGTTATLPPGRTYLSTDYYLANACAFGGLNYGIRQIEQIVGVRADYVATVGFSQALGIFRTIGLPTTDTLAFLRHRRSYQIGDPQRSHNQSVFMKDTALRLLSDDGLSTPLLHILYSFVDTDLDFKSAQALYTAYRAAELNEDDIVLDIKPHYDVVDMHFDPSNADVQVQALIDFLKGKVSSEDLSLRTLDDVQRELEEYMRGALASEEEIAHVVEEQLWEQLEDNDVRQELHFRFLARYLETLVITDQPAAEQMASDYVLEMEYLGETYWADLGRNMLASLVDE